MGQPTSEDLRLLSNQEFERVRSWLPTDPTSRLCLFIEATRAIDFDTLGNPLVAPSHQISEPDLDLLRVGWNVVSALCLSPFAVEGAFPMRKSTDESLRMARAPLHQCGRSVLLRRAADMVDHGYLACDRIDGGYRLARAPHSGLQFLDAVDHEQLRRFERYLWQDERPSVDGWTLLDFEDAMPVNPGLGAFLGRRRKDSRDLLLADPEAAMLPLIQPRDYGYGKMLTYGADPAVDDHFLANASDFMEGCHKEFGVHPLTSLPGIPTDDLLLIATYVASLHLKHRQFALLALKHHPDILLPQSLTIWNTKSELGADLADWTGLPVSRVSVALDALTLRATEASHLERQAQPLVPLLVSLDNGILVRPLSSVFKNPLVATMSVLAHRDNRVRNALNTPREAWLRSDLYGLFQGTRYHCVEGNVKLRSGSKIATDIDAAILDRTTGELGLFQLKWQDFFTADVRELRSRASNLVHELDDWAERICAWIESHSPDDLESALRFQPGKHGHVRGVLLFGISKSAARVQGYGFSSRHESLAVGSWPLFFRLRRQVGPTASVLSDIHRALRKEAAATIDIRAIPREWTVAGVRVRFEDFWSAVGEPRVPDPH